MLVSNKNLFEIIILEGQLYYHNLRILKSLGLDYFKKVSGTTWLDQWQGQYHLTAIDQLQRAFLGNETAFTFYKNVQNESSWWEIVLIPILKDKRTISVFALSRDVTSLLESKMLIENSIKKEKLFHS